MVTKPKVKIMISDDIFPYFFHIFPSLKICLFCVYVKFGAKRINWNEKKGGVTVLALGLR